MSTNNSTLGYLAALAGLGAGLIAIYQWLKNTECVTEGSMFYGGSVCGWLDLNPAGLNVTNPSGGPVQNPVDKVFPQSMQFLATLGVGQASQIFITNVTAEAVAAGWTDQQLLAFLQSKFSDYGACQASNGTWNADAGDCLQIPTIPTIPSVLPSPSTPPSSVPASAIINSPTRSVTSIMSPGSIPLSATPSPLIVRQFAAQRIV